MLRFPVAFKGSQNLAQQPQCNGLFMTRNSECLRTRLFIMVYLFHRCSFQDLCQLTNGDNPYWLQGMTTMTRTFGLELLESILRHYPKAFLDVSWFAFNFIPAAIFFQPRSQVDSYKILLICKLDIKTKFY